MTSSEVINKPISYDGPETGSYEVPSYSTPGSAAMDLLCTEDITIYPQERVIIPTGLAIWIGSGKLNNCSRGIKTWYDYETQLAGLIMPRSGLGTKGLVLANTIGLIDSDYQGELKISAWNSLQGSKIEEGKCDGYTTYTDSHPQNIIKLKAGDRIAQLMIIPYIKAQWEIVNEFSSKTDRSDGGFGSTGS